MEGRSLNADTGSVEQDVEGNIISESCLFKAIVTRNTDIIKLLLIGLADDIKNINFSLFRYLVKAMGDHEEVSSLRSVVVIEESETDRNEVFFDTKNDTTFFRDEFVFLIRNGEYPGYDIRMINGIETPVSKPDKVLSNNLC